MPQVLDPQAAPAPPAPPAKAARAPTPLEYGANSALRTAAFCLAGATIGLVFFIVFTILRDSWTVLAGDGGVSLLAGRIWDPNMQEYGLLPAIVGTLTSSLLALAIGSVFGVAIAIILTQDFLPKKVALVLKNVVDLLAAIPSVVYGLWGLAVVTPLLKPTATWLNVNLGWVPFFNTPLGIGGLAPAALVLAIMVLPTVAAISRDALASVHYRTKEAAYGLGATRWEVIFGVMLPTAAAGIFGGMILGFGRALGETMALAMLMGNRNDLSWSLFSPGNTLAALVANNYKEADANLLPRLFFASLVLLVITLSVNVLGTLTLQHAAAALGGKKKK